MTMLDPENHEAQTLVPTGPGPVHSPDGEVPPEPAATAKEPFPEADADWGISSGGWIVRIHNLTDQPVTPWHMGSDMVRTAPVLIAPGATATVLGKPDSLRGGHPASMSIDLRIDGWPNVLLVRRVGRSDAFTATVYGCEPWTFTFADHRLDKPLTLAVTSRTSQLGTGRTAVRARQWRTAPRAVFLVPAERPGRPEPVDSHEDVTAAAA
ncbi:hypothetical protein ACFXPI_27150 [Streptomyces sp. NPDC059104]|uniref:hypothetical protein n=1 Tax=Streptomyces sp. NPDC059104 TaxID=3346729 RepID=UPI0036CD4A46